jgi:serine phosphatase RsbU (regulator of sigma subunit)/CHASE3 domain sensor protein
MKRISAIRIGQVIGLGFGLILFLALLIGLGGRIAYDVSRRQRDVIQTRGDVGRLTLELQFHAVQRTTALRRYLESESALFLVEYRDTEVAYDRVFAQLQHLLHTPDEIQALQAVIKAEAAFDSKAQEVFRLYDSQFPGTARFLWVREGSSTQNELLRMIETLRQVQDDASERIINEARQTENLVIVVVSIFIGLALVGGIAASLLISRSITKPLSHLVKTTTRIGSDLTTRVKPSGPQEIAFLGKTINEMAAHLFSSRQALQQHRDTLEHELNLASQVQASFFPDTLPQFQSLELAAFWQPAREMGGDFYTCIELDNGQQGIVVGDVSGKGAPAAMAGALAVGLLEAYAPSHYRPETLLAKLNQDLYARFISNYINVACCYLVLDTKSFHLRVANAGGVYPYLRRAGHLREVDVFGLPLGMLLDYTYIPQSLSLNPGDLLLLSSDGLVEARNEQGKIFGFDRLQAELRNLPASVSAQTAVDHLVGAAMTFTGNADLQDDLTILVMRVVEK